MMGWKIKYYEDSKAWTAFLYKQKHIFDALQFTTSIMIGGKMIAGLTDMKKKTIDIYRHPGWRFTLAHELAHVYIDEYPNLDENIMFRHLEKVANTKTTQELEELLVDVLAQTFIKPKYIPKYIKEN